MLQRRGSFHTLKAMSICLACLALLLALGTLAYAQDDELISTSEAARLVDEDYDPRVCQKR